MISVDHHDTVAVVSIDRGVTHPLDLETVTALSDTFRRLDGRPDVHGVVLTSAGGKFFSIGFDLPELIEQGRPEFEQFYRAFNRTSLDILTTSKPTVAAMTGHAVAGGCVLALCCDYRFVAAGKTLTGLNEVRLGVPVPYPADCALRALVGDRIARDIMESGVFYRPDDALALGLVDSVLPADRVVSEAVGKIRALYRTPGTALRTIKHNRVEPLVRLIMDRLEEKEKIFLDCWFSQEARENLRKATEKF